MWLEEGVCSAPVRRRHSGARQPLDGALATQVHPPSPEYLAIGSLGDGSEIEATRITASTEECAQATI